MTETVFTLADYGSVHPVVEAAIGNRHVRRMVGDLLVEGTARAIGTDNGCRAASGSDVRDLFLRVTTSSGWEVFWPVRDLMHDAKQGLFVVDSAGAS